MKPQQNKVAFVTGTSSGLGLMTSIMLAEEGYHVVASMRNTTKKEKLVSIAIEKGVFERISIVEMDVSKEEQVQEVMKRVLFENNQIDVLINNAGISLNGFIEELPMEYWHRVFQTNLFGAIACTKAVLPHMRLRSSGIIINISSVAGRIGEAMWGPYAVSKFALEGFTESLRSEMEPFGLKIALIQPGPFKSEAQAKSQNLFYLEENSPYRNVAEQMMGFFNRMADNAIDPSEIVDVIRRILNTQESALRYPIGRIGDKTIEEKIRSHIMQLH